MDEPIVIRLGGYKISPAKLARFSKAIRQQRGEMCERCGGAGNHVHHIFEKAAYPMLALMSDNVVVLCESCHRQATSIQRSFPDFAPDFYARFPPSVLRRIVEFREKAPWHSQTVGRSPLKQRGLSSVLSSLALVWHLLDCQPFDSIWFFYYGNTNCWTVQKSARNQTANRITGIENPYPDGKTTEGFGRD